MSLRAKAEALISHGRVTRQTALDAAYLGNDAIFTHGTLTDDP